MIFTHFCCSMWFLDGPTYMYKGLTWVPPIIQAQRKCFFYLKLYIWRLTPIENNWSRYVGWSIGTTLEVGLLFLYGPSLASALTSSSQKFWSETSGKEKENICQPSSQISRLVWQLALLTNAASHITEWDEIKVIINMYSVYMCRCLLKKKYMQADDLFTFLDFWSYYNNGRRATWFLEYLKRKNSYRETNLRISRVTAE